MKKLVYLLIGLFLIATLSIGCKAKRCANFDSGKNQHVHYNKSGLVKKKK